MTTTDLAVLGTAALALLANGAISNSGKARDTIQPQPVAVAPVLHFSVGSRIEVQVDFQNTSSQPVRYLLGHYPLEKDGGGVAHLHFLAYKDGQYIAPRETEEPPEAVPRRVRELRPGQRVPHLLRIWNIYGDLQPGKYELTARYSIEPWSATAKELGLTPMSFERKVLYLEIDPKGAQKVSGTNGTVESAGEL